jgi:hypothetical protein
MRLSLTFLPWILLSLLLYNSTQLHGQPSIGPGNSLPFNGSSTLITCGTGNRGVSNRVTIESWIRTSSFNNQWVLGKYSDQFGEEKGYCLATWNGLAIAAGRAKVGTYLTSGFSTTRVDDNRWHHLAAVIDNNIWNIYVDGVLESSVTYSYAAADLTNSQPMVVGEYFNARSRPFTGEIDELRVWNTARTESQIRETMCKKFAAAPSELVAYYRFDQSNGTTAIDSGSQPANGTLLNFSNQPWQRSGAAIGDRSTFVYGNLLSNLTLPTSANAFVRATNFTATARGAGAFQNRPPL